MHGSFSSYRCFGLPWYWRGWHSEPSKVLTWYQGAPGTPRDIETAFPNLHCIFANIGYDVEEQLGGSNGSARRGTRRRWRYTRDASYRRLPLLYAGGAIEWHTFPSCFVASAPRGAMAHEAYCFSPQLVHAGEPRSYAKTYERGVVLSWSGGMSNFGHMGHAGARLNIPRIFHAYSTHIPRIFHAPDGSAFD